MIYLLFAVLAQPFAPADAVMLDKAKIYIYLDQNPITDCAKSKLIDLALNGHLGDLPQKRAQYINDLRIDIGKYAELVYRDDSWVESSIDLPAISFRDRDTPIPIGGWEEHKGSNGASCIFCCEVDLLQHLAYIARLNHYVDRFYRRKSPSYTSQYETLVISRTSSTGSDMREDGWNKRVFTRKYQVWPVLNCYPEPYLDSDTYVRTTLTRTFIKDNVTTKQTIIEEETTKREDIIEYVRKLDMGYGILEDYIHDLETGRYKIRPIDQEY